ncbi:hypothetical protein, partial [Sphingomonas hylomeconis]
MKFEFGAGSVALIMAGTVPAAAAPAPVQASHTDDAAPIPTATLRQIKTLRVEGSQRIEPDTVLSYTKLRVGQNYT